MAEGYNPRRNAAMRAVEELAGRRSREVVMSKCLKILHSWRTYSAAVGRMYQMGSASVAWVSRKWDSFVLLGRIVRQWRVHVAEGNARHGPIQAAVEGALGELEAKVASVQGGIQQARVQLQGTLQQNELLRRAVQKADQLCGECVQWCGQRAAGAWDANIQLVAVNEPASSSSSPILNQGQRRERLLAELRDTACALAHALLVLDDAEEFERLLEHCKLRWRQLHGGVRPSLEKEREGAASAKLVAREEVTTLEANVRSPTRRQPQRCSAA